MAEIQPIESRSWFRERLAVYLEKNNLKQTKQRNIILDYLLQAKEHICPEDVRELAKKDGYNIGLSTIYRTMNLFRLAGIVEQTTFIGERSLFELVSPNSHHDHLVCLACNKIVEFHNAQIENLQIEVAKENGFTLLNHKLDLFGHCQNCREKSLH